MNTNAYTLLRSTALALLMASATAMAQSTTGQSTAATPTITPPEGYHLVWNEEFDYEGAPDPSRWSHEQGFVRNHELQWYQPQNAAVHNGLLTIEARGEDRPNPLYRPHDDADAQSAATPQHRQRRNDWRSQRPTITCTSASINTRGHFAFLYGRLEVRARIPVGYGSWPAIWLLGEGRPWPACGEIDVMEFYRTIGGTSTKDHSERNQPSILANACWANERPNDAIWNSRVIPLSHFTEKDPFWFTRFHVWRMDWDEHQILLYLDDELLNTIDLSVTINRTPTDPSPVNPFHHPQYILLNLAIGGDNGGPLAVDGLPLRYDVDYVRVFQRD